VRQARFPPEMRRISGLNPLARGRILLPFQKTAGQCLVRGGSRPAGDPERSDQVESIGVPGLLIAC
jgi:hypothetical protein